MTQTDRINSMKEGKSFIIIDRGQAGLGEPLEVPADNVYVIDETKVVPKAGETLYISMKDDDKVFVSRRESFVKGKLKSKVPIENMLKVYEVKEKVVEVYSSRIAIVILGIILISLILWLTKFYNQPELIAEQAETPHVEATTVKEHQVQEWEQPKDFVDKLKIADDELQDYDLKVAQSVEINEESYIIAGFNKLQKEGRNLDDIRIALFSNDGDLLYESENYSSRKNANADEAYPFQSIYALPFKDDLFVMIKLINTGSQEQDQYTHLLGYIINQQGELTKVYERSARNIELALGDNEFLIDGDLGKYRLTLKKGQVVIKRQ